MPTEAETGEGARPGADAAPAGAGASLAAGRLGEAERSARYRLVAPLARDKRVLDAGCGTAEGCVVLAAAGAASVVGVDPEQAVIEAVRPRMPPGIELARAEPDELPHADDSFDLVTCFGAARQPGGARKWLDELVRVLAPGGVLAVAAEPSAAADVERALADRVGNLLVVRQRAWVALSLLAEASGRAGDAGSAETRVAADPAAEDLPDAGVVVLASAAALPELPQLVALAEPLDEARLTVEIERMRAELRARADRIAELAAADADREKLRQLLTESEQLLAEMPELRRRSAELERISSSAEWRIATALRAPGTRAEGMWLPAARRRLKQLLGWLIRRLGSTRRPS